MVTFKTTLAAKRERAKQIYEILRDTYYEPGCTLDYDRKNPLQLLISTILAAQCTDKRVNLITPALFAKYKTATDFANARQADLEAAIHTCGFFRHKARCIRNACRTIVEEFGGQVPRTMDELLRLDGVGRKTANCVLGDCFDTPGVVVDTHCMRLSRRLGFTVNTDPVRIEQDLMKILDQPTWSKFSHCMVFHGRAVCHSRRPNCAECEINMLCPSRAE